PPDALLHTLGDERLGRAAELGALAPDRREDRRIGGFHHGHVALGVELPFLQEVACDRVRRTAESAGRERLAFDEGREVAALRRETLFGAEIDVAAIDAVHDGAKLRAL